MGFRFWVTKPTPKPVSLDEVLDEVVGGRFALCYQCGADLKVVEFNGLLKVKPCRRCTGIPSTVKLKTAIQEAIFEFIEEYEK